MKKISALLLALVLTLSLSVTAFAAAGDTTLTYDLSSGGSHDITVKTGDEITVVYKLSADKACSSIAIQNEIYYDHTFFAYVDGSAVKKLAGYTTSTQVRGDGKHYVYFNGLGSYDHSATPVEVGTFKLKVIATSGQTTIASVNAKAMDKDANAFGSETVDLHVSIGSQQDQTFKVTYLDGNGGTYKSETVKAGDRVTLPTGPSKTDYTFSHWSLGGDTTQYKAGSSYTPTSDVSFTPNWTKNDSGNTGGGGSGGSGGGSSSAVKYKVSVAGVSNGSVTVSHKTAASGVTVTVTTSPSTGYALDSVAVTLDKTGKTVTLSNKGSGKYTFTMPTGDVTVKAAFAKSKDNPFTDVPSGSYYEDAVDWATKNGITGGTTATTFDPNGICTRAQAVTFLWRAAGSPAPQSSVMPFTDVPAGSYYYNAVLWAVENGITKGTTDTTFSPDMKCTRGQIVTFLWRSQKSPAATAANPFTDVPAGAYYTDAVLWAVQENVTSGTTASTFSPSNPCTRAQIVTFIYRALAD